MIDHDAFAMVRLTRLELSGGLIALRLIEALSPSLARNAVGSGVQLAVWKYGQFTIADV
jgi:hypothetical protein